MTSLPGTPSKQTLSPYRLRRHADYQRVYQASRKYHSASTSYFFRVRPPAELPPAIGPRIGLTVGRVMGKAVERNRIKRRMREAVRLHLSILLDAPAAQNRLDLVLHPRKTAALVEFAVLEREMAALFTQVTRLAAHPQPPPSPRTPTTSRAKRAAPRKPPAPPVTRAAAATTHSASEPQ